MAKSSSNRALRAIPAVEKILQNLGPVDLPRTVVVAVVRRELEALRSEESIPEFDSVLRRMRDALREVQGSRIQPVLNGTGILVHTNLGRAPLSAEAVRTLLAVAAQYNNLEYDLTLGERGGRGRYLEENLARLCGAESATVVNNCAAALILILRSFAAGEKNEVVISRGELVQIGGGFRIPEILEASGARLREVGTTNQTALADYERAIGQETALILKVHRSNFFMGGFVESPSTEQLALLAGRRKVLFAEDLGSGAMAATELAPGVEHEPMPEEILRQGADLVCFSGDKLLGGPQAGIIAGKGAFIKQLKSAPFFRALRCDKLILATLQTTVDLYLSAGEKKEEAFRSIPVLRMMRLSCDELRTRAEPMVNELRGLPVTVKVGTGEAQIGGGTLPRSVIPSVTLDLIPGELNLQSFAECLRMGTPPLIGYISGQRFKIDLRTIFPEQDAMVVGVIGRAIRGS